MLFSGETRKTVLDTAKRRIYAKQVKSTESVINDEDRYPPSPQSVPPNNASCPCDKSIVLNIT